MSTMKKERKQLYGGGRIPPKVAACIKDLRRCRRLAERNLHLMRGVDPAKLGGPALAIHERGVACFSRVLSIVTPQVLERANLEELIGVCRAIRTVAEEPPACIN
jgi:hypothetical protein